MAVNWSKKVKDHIKKIEDLNPEDRLQTVAAIRECWIAVNSSQLGWAQWITNVRLLSLLPEELLKHFLDVFRNCAVAFLKFDMAATNAVSPFLKVGMKGRTEQSKKQSHMIS